MPKASEHHSSKIVKLLYIGDSGTGKTGSLASLVADGYKLRILDLDNGIDPLIAFVRRDSPANLDNIEYETRRDKYKGTASGPIVSGQPRAFVDSLSLMTKWTSEPSDPSSWGEDTIFVLDSLTAMGRNALDWATGMAPMAKDPRNWYFTAQKAVENVIAMLTSEGFNCNVIVITHVQFKELPDGTTRGYANAVGSALGPIIPKYFNSVVLAQSQGSGKNVKRTIQTVPTAFIDLKNPAPFKIDQILPLETGLSTLFKTLKDKT